MLYDDVGGDVFITDVKSIVHTAISLFIKLLRCQRYNSAIDGISLQMVLIKNHTSDMRITKDTAKTNSIFGELERPNKWHEDYKLDGLQKFVLETAWAGVLFKKPWACHAMPWVGGWCCVQIAARK